MEYNLGKVLLTPKGDYNNNTTYEILDVVTYNYSSYVAKQPTIGNPPSEGTTNEYWQLLAHAGDPSGKADKVSGATNGDFAGLDGNGNLIDSGYSPSDFITDLQVNGSPVAIGGVASIFTEGSYNASTNKIATVSDLPVVPVISTDIEADGSSDTKTASPKAVKTFVENKGYANKVSGATSGNFAALDSTGNLIDSGTNSATFLTSQEQSDWEEENTTEVDYIKNKPSIRKGIGNNSVSIGNGTIAYGDASVAEGSINSVSFFASGSAGSTTYSTDSAHNLIVGDILKWGDKLRIVTNIPTATSFTVNSTFSSSALVNEQMYRYNGVAYGSFSHSEGYSTNAVGNTSHTEGNNTIATNFAEHAQGTFNKSNKENNIWGKPGNTLHSVGFGTSNSDRKNVYEVMQNGDIYVYGIGSYDGTNPDLAETLQSVVSSGVGAVTDVQVNGSSVTNNGVADILTETAYNASTNKIATVSDLPVVPVISTDIEADGTSDTKTASPKAVKTFVENKGYANKVSGATLGNFAALDSTGNLTDSGYDASDFALLSQLPEYTIVESPTPTPGYLKTYKLQKDGSDITGSSVINIPKDFLVQSGSVIDVVEYNGQYYNVTDTEHTNPLPVSAPGKYLDFVVNVVSGTATNEHIYIAVNDLVDVYTGGNGIDISNLNVVSVKLDTANANGLSTSSSGISLATVVASSGGVGGSNGAMSATDKEKLDSITEGSEPNMTSITYSELVALRNGGTLVPGMRYRITDYVCTTVQTNTSAASNQFDVIVVADSTSALNEMARVIEHVSAIQVEDASNNNIKYIYTRYSTGDGADGKAWAFVNNSDDKEIGDSTLDYTSIDSSDLIYTESEIPDVGDILDIGGVPVTLVDLGDPYFHNSHLESWELKYCLDNDTSRFDWADSNNGKGVIYYMKDEWNNECPYDFKNIMFVRPLTNGVLDTANGTDTPVYTFATYDDDDDCILDASMLNKEGENNQCSCNRIYPFIENVGIDSGLRYLLNDNVFLNYGVSLIRCKVNTMMGNCSSNTFGNDCYNNTLMENCYSNTFGDGCNENTIGISFSGNIVGSSFQVNTVSHSCSDNTFGNFCKYGYYGSNFSSNTVGNYIYHIATYPDVVYCNITGGTGVSNKVQNVQILSGVRGSLQSPLSISLQTELANSQFVGLRDVPGTYAERLCIWDAMPGRLYSDTQSQTPPTSGSYESFGDDITLHKIAWTGTYSDLSGTPTIPTAVGNSKVFYGTCSTAAETTTKDVTCSDFTSTDLVDGAMVLVKFSVTNSGAVASLKLNVNQTGEYPIKKIYNAAINNLTGAGELRADAVIPFVFTGTYWMVSGYDYNSTYSAMSVAEIMDGTSTSGRIVSGKLLKDNFDILNGNTIKMRGSTVTVPPQLVAGTDLEIVPTSGLLPSGYTQLQYIGTNKDAWFLSDLKVNDFDKVTTDIVLLERASNTGSSYSPSVFGSSAHASTVTNNCKALRLYYGTPYYIFGYYGSTYSTSNWTQNSTEGIDLGVLTSIEIGLKSGEQYIKKNGTVIAQNASTATLTNDYNVAILGHNMKGTVKYIPHMLCYSMTFYLNNVAVANYIPARRDSDDAVGMYDLVTNTFYVSEGTGQFTAGNTVIPHNVINFTNNTGYITNSAISDVVHKSGAETITGAKTFDNVVALTSGNSLEFVADSGQNQVDVYLDDAVNGNAVLFVEDTDGGVGTIVRGLATPLAPSDAANKEYVDDKSDMSVTLNGYSGSYGIQEYSLCACAISSGTSTVMTSFTTSGGTSSKSAYYQAYFPIGCKIYYYPSGSSFSHSTAFTSKTFKTSCNKVDGRYSAITGTSLTLGSSSNSSVYLRVSAQDGLWAPYSINGETHEIIVTSNQLVSGNFYIYLGKTVGNTGYEFQLEDNNPLYYYYGTNLIDWATYNSDRIASLYTGGEGISISPSCIISHSGWQKSIKLQNDVVLNNGNETISYHPVDVPPIGTYILCGQALITNPNSTTQQGHALLRYRTSSNSSYTVVAATSFLLPIAKNSSSGGLYGAGSVFLQGPLTLSAQPSYFEIEMYIEVETDGSPSTVIATAPISGIYADAMTSGATNMMVYRIGS